MDFPLWALRQTAWVLVLHLLLTNQVTLDNSTPLAGSQRFFCLLVCFFKFLLEYS